jgi:uncharacterized protein YkwD
MAMIGPHDFVPTQYDEQSCDVCSGVPGDPIHRIGVGSRTQQAPELPQQQASGQTKGRKSVGWVLVAVGGIAAVVFAVGYLLLGGDTKMGDGSTVASPQASTVVPADSTSATVRVRGSEKWIATLEFAVHQLVNFERQKNSLSVLDQDPELAEIARAHSDDMALNDFFEHENLQGQMAADRGNSVGYTCLKNFGDFYTEGISENLFQGYLYSSSNRLRRNYIALEDLAFKIVEDWMNSPGHRENILTETYDREGIAVVIGDDESVWVTQNFC